MKKKISVIVRIVFGVLLLGIGLSNLLGLMPAMQYPEAADEFMTALTGTGYMMVIVSLLKVIVGVSLLFNLFVPLALVVFMPISINMILFHLFLDVNSIFPALVIGVLNIYLLVINLESYNPLLKVKNE